MDSPDQTARLRLGFYSLFPTPEAGGYLGAILLTDSLGVPQEFRCTHPVKPTNIQRPLYGDTLEPFVGISLCGLPLLASLQTKPNLLLVNLGYLLELRPETTLTTVFIQRAGEAIEITDEEPGQSKGLRERLESSSGRFQPVVVSTHPGYPDDLAVARNVIDSAFSTLDPLEPFDRMSRALEVLAKQDSRFQ